MFSNIKRARFNNKVNEFKKYITNTCIEENRKQGLLDELYVIGLYKKEASVTIKDNGSIIIDFDKGILYDVDFTVTLNENIGTMVTYIDDNNQLQLLEFDRDNENQLFSKYIDIFLSIYNN